MTHTYTAVDLVGDHETCQSIGDKKDGFRVDIKPINSHTHGAEGSFLLAK